MQHLRLFVLIGFVLSVTSPYSLLANTEPDCLCPSVTGVSATSTATSLTVSWTASAAFDNYIVHVLKGGMVHFKSTTVGVSTVISGTSPATVYTVQVFGICKDGQAGYATSNTVTTISATTNCGKGAADIGGNDQANATQILTSSLVMEQIESVGDQDYYYFVLPEPGGFDVTLGSMINDYDLSVYAGNNTPPFIGFSIFSENPGTTAESVYYNTIGLQVQYPLNVYVVVVPHGTAYNSYDCYELLVQTSGFTGGGGSNMVSGSGSGLEVTPDPSGSSLSFTFDSSFQADDQVDVQVFSVEGRVVLTESVQVFKGEKQIKLDLPNMSDGIYFVNATGAFGKKSQKFVVAK